MSVALVILVFLGSALSFLYSFQVYQRRFLKQSDGADRYPRAARLLVAALATSLLLIGLWPEPLVALAEAAAVLSAGRVQ